MRTSFSRIFIVLLAVCSGVGALTSVPSAAGTPVVYAVGTLPAGGGYLFCYPAAVGGANPANPGGGFVGAATTLKDPDGVTASAATSWFYVTDMAANAVDKWHLPCPSPVVNVPPARRLIGPATGLNAPLGIAVDTQRGVMYVANQANNTVSIFRIGAIGNTPPICVLAGAATQLSKPAHLAIEPPVVGARHPGFLYVANSGGASITVYHPKPCGNVPPAFMIHGPATKLAVPYGVDAEISQFPGHAGVSAIYVGDPQAGQVFVYKDGLPANQVPFEDLGGAPSTLACPSDVRISPTTALTYVEDPCAVNTPNPPGRIDAFAPNAVFNVAPALWYVAPPGIVSSPLGLWLFDRN